MNTLQLCRLLLECYEVRSAKAADLLEALQKGSQRTWVSGENLCSEGASSTEMFIILTGGIQVFKKDDAQLNREIAILSAPTMIGQMGLIENVTRSATCVAMGNIQGISIKKDIFHLILKSADPASSAFRHLLLASMSMQLFTANGKIRKLIEELEITQRDIEKNTDPDLISSSSKRVKDISDTLDGWNTEEQKEHS